MRIWGVTGCGWFAAVGFFKESALWGLSIQRTVGEGAFEETEKLVLAKLSQRLTETATLSTAVGRLVLSNVTKRIQSCQEGRDLAWFGAVLDANASAEAIFDDDFYVAGRRVVIRDNRSMKLFDEFLLRLSMTPENCSVSFKINIPQNRNAQTRRAGCFSRPFAMTVQRDVGWMTSIFPRAR
jgi:hypothetical protein